MKRRKTSFKRLRLTVVVAGLVIVTIISYAHYANPSAAQQHAASISKPSPSPSVGPAEKPMQKRVGKPRMVYVPKLSIEAKLQYVGKNKEGNMGAPTQLNDASWYKYGAKPGEQGNAVIAGHFGPPNKQGAFWNLRSIQKGDTIEVLDEYNQRLYFTVTDKQAFDPENDDAPLEQIFGGSNERHLNLITCDGPWDKNKHDYAKRLVVFATFKGVLTE